MKNKSPVPQTTPSRFIGIDWADRKHDVHAVDPHGNGQSRTVEQSPEAIEEWITDELTKAGGTVAIILEQSRGALIHALMFRENVILYPVNPQQFARGTQTPDAKTMSPMQSCWPGCCGNESGVLRFDCANRQDALS